MTDVANVAPVATVATVATPPRTYIICPKCSNTIAETAWQVHNDLNHPKRAVTEATLAALAKATAARKASLDAKQARVAALTPAWEGAK